jgi:nucleotide-binding universal stress UspA family protein
MARILCATRGGEASYRTQDAAIRLARDSGDELFFLYVVNLEFLAKTARAVRPDVVSAELTKMGEFLLEMARERAEAQGVSAELVLRHGNLWEELVAAVRELEITTVVLGRPADGGAYSLDDLEAFSAQIEAETDAQAFVFR